MTLCGQRLLLTKISRPVRTCRQLKRNTGWRHTEVVHTPQACIFRALEARGTYISRSSRHFVAKQVVCAEER